MTQKDYPKGRRMSDKQPASKGRRQFLTAVGGLGVATAFGTFLGRAGFGPASYTIPGYGKLRPVSDETTGLELLCLPEGFRYRSFGWTGDRMTDGTTTPGAHDGMGIIKEDDGIITIVRNHELQRRTGTFGTSDIQFDAKGGGGCTNLTFNSRTGEWLGSRPSLAGTVKNCAGGPTPWGTWLSCEESVLGPGSVAGGEVFDFQKDHGWIFEVPADGDDTPIPLKAMGRFVHEAIAVDPDTGIVYETEDRVYAGFYRFTPHKPGQLAAGGQLQMLKAVGRDDLRKGLTVGMEFDVAWVDIEDVERAHSPDSPDDENADGDEHGVFMQGKAQGATTFARLEGCWYGNNLIYLDSTTGGDRELGQIWQYDPRNERLKLIFESPHKDVLDSPDNITVSPRGGVVLCEDGDVLPQRIHGLTPEGQLFTFAKNNVVLRGEHNGIEGDFRDQEYAGSTFSSDGKWLFVNIQNPGITFAITGPWGNGLL